MHLNGEYLDCKMLSVMMSHLNSLNYFSLGIESLWTQPFIFGWDFIDNDNFEGQRLKFLKYPSSYNYTMRFIGYDSI